MLQQKTLNGSKIFNSKTERSKSAQRNFMQ